MAHSDTDSGDQRRRLADDEWRVVADAMARRMDDQDRVQSRLRDDVDGMRDDLDEVREGLSEVRGGMKAMSQQLDAYSRTFERIEDRLSRPRS